MGVVQNSFNIAAMLTRFWYHISWPIANGRVAFVILAMIGGVVLANLLGKASGSKRTKRARLLRSVIGLLFGLWASTSLVAASIFTHAVDLRWLPKGQQTAPSIPTPTVHKAPSLPIVGDVLQPLINDVAGALESTVSHANSALHPLLSVELEIRAIQVAAGLVVQYALLAALSGSVLAVLLWIAHIRYKRGVNRRLDTLERRLNALTG